MLHASCADTAAFKGPKVALVSTLSSMSPAPPFVFRNYQLPLASEALAGEIGAHAGSCKHPVWQAVRASSAASFYLEDFRCVCVCACACGLCVLVVLWWVPGGRASAQAAVHAAALPPACLPASAAVAGKEEGWEQHAECALTPPAPPTPPRPHPWPHSSCSCGGDKFQDGAVTANNPSVIALQEARLLWPGHPLDVVVSLGVGQGPPARRERGLNSFMETGSILIESRWVPGACFAGWVGGVGGWGGPLPVPTGGWVGDCNGTFVFTVLLLLLLLAGAAPMCSGRRRRWPRCSPWCQASNTSGEQEEGVGGWPRCRAPVYCQRLGAPLCFPGQHNGQGCGMHA